MSMNNKRVRSEEFQCHVFLDTRPSNPGLGCAPSTVVGSLTGALNPRSKPEKRKRERESRFIEHYTLMSRGGRRQEASRLAIILLLSSSACMGCSVATTRTAKCGSQSCFQFAHLRLAVKSVLCSTDVFSAPMTRCTDLMHMVVVQALW
jgi:hypothetical protein